MALILKNDDFSEAAKTASVDDAMRDTDFLGRAMKLFTLRESLWDAFDKTDKEITDLTEERKEKRSGTPSNIAFGVAGIAGFAGMAALFAPVGIVLGVVAAAVGVLTGLVGALIVGSILECKPEREGKEAHDAMAAQNDKIQSRITREIDGMDKSLISQVPSIRDEFRSAFRHDALKMELRENRIHRAKMEQKAQEAADDASTAATMASVAAMNATIASMNH